MSSATVNDFFQAITSSGSSKDDLNIIYDSVKKFSEATSKNKDIKVFLSNDIYPAESKLDVIKDVVGEKHQAINFFKTIIDFGILNDLIGSSEFFLKKIRSILSKVKVKVVVSSLTQRKEEIVRKGLEEVWGSDLEIDFFIDKEIIGGVILQVEDKFFDGSISGKLKKINNII